MTTRKDLIKDLAKNGDFRTAQEIAVEEKVDQEGVSGLVEGILQLPSVLEEFSGDKGLTPLKGKIPGPRDQWHGHYQVAEEENGV